MTLRTLPLSHWYALNRGSCVFTQRSRPDLSLHALKIDEYKNRNAEWTQKRVTAVKVQREFAELLTEELPGVDPTRNSQLKSTSDAVTTKLQKKEDLSRQRSNTREVAATQTTGKALSRVHDQGANHDQDADDCDMDELFAAVVPEKAPTKVSASASSPAVARPRGHSNAVVVAASMTSSAHAVDVELEQVTQMPKKRKHKGNTSAEVGQQSADKLILTTSAGIDEHDATAAAGKKSKLMQLF